MVWISDVGWRKGAPPTECAAPGRLPTSIVFDTCPPNPDLVMILGLHFGPHDSSASIVNDGVVLATMEQERFDHIKHSGRFPFDAINFCLDAAGMKLHEVSAVAYASDVDLTNRYKRAFVDAAYPGAFQPPLHEQSDLEEFLRSKISFEGRLLHCDHHHGHAASVFFTSPFDESAIFTVDGVGNWVSFR
jgi:carbamoyltransferase